MDSRHQCKNCNKNYSSYKSLWHHNNKYHKPLDKPDISQHKPDISQNGLSKDGYFKCDFCEKKYKHYQSRWKHQSKCENINKTLLETNNNNFNELKKKYDELQGMFLELLNKNAKIHPKTLQKMNKNLINSNNNNSNNTTNNSNNTTNNITNNIIQVVKFGRENLSSLLTKKELLSIFNDRSKCLEKSISLVHLNNERKEYRNVYITNIHDNFAYIFNGEKFEIVNKTEILKELIDNHFDNIILQFEDYKKKLNPNTVKAIELFIQEMNDENIQVTDEKANKIFKNYRYYKINEIKLLIYNQKDNKIPTNVVNLIFKEDDEEDEEKNIIDV